MFSVVYIVLFMEGGKRVRTSGSWSVGVRVHSSGGLGGPWSGRGWLRGQVLHGPEGEGVRSGNQVVHNQGEARCSMFPSSHPPGGLGKGTRGRYCLVMIMRGNLIYVDEHISNIRRMVMGPEEIKMHILTGRFPRTAPSTTSNLDVIELLQCIIGVTLIPYSSR